MIGDSNFRCINENGVMASDTAVTGGKLGHICNQLDFENVNKVDTIIISAGQNCTNDADDVEKTAWETRTNKELGKVKGAVMDKGKHIIMLSVPPVPCTQTSTRKKEARYFVNKGLPQLVRQANSIGSKPGTQRILGRPGLSLQPRNRFQG